MEQKIDLTLYNRIKERFSAKRGVHTFISIGSDNVDALVAENFDDEDGYFDLVRDHQNAKKAYAVFKYDEEGPIYLFASKAFWREENLATGKIKDFKRNPYHRPDFNSELVRKDLAVLAKLLMGDSEAF